MPCASPFLLPRIDQRSALHYFRGFTFRLYTAATIPATMIGIEQRYQTRDGPDLYLRPALCRIWAVRTRHGSESDNQRHRELLSLAPGDLRPCLFRHRAWLAVRGDLRRQVPDAAAARTSRPPGRVLAVARGLGARTRPEQYPSRHDRRLGLCRPL